jgi:hypothetical protein
LNILQEGKEDDDEEDEPTPELELLEMTADEEDDLLIVSCAH